MRRLVGRENAPSAPQEVSRPQTAKARTGAEGEDAAAAHLCRLGWKILDRNWRSRHLELDIVAEERDTVVFVEVKTRAEGGLQSPFEA
ncbi:MAG: YraN family protein, partial [Mailhella sp.]|nr:YraN family protein [Mailhella sp.]